jgi:hypothetical protein
LDPSHTWDTYLSAGRDVSQPANVCDKGVCLPSITDNADTATDDMTDDETDEEIDEETDDSDVDNAFGASPRLVSESDSLSQYHGRSLAQASADTLATEELTPTYHSLSSGKFLCSCGHRPATEPLQSRRGPTQHPDHPRLSTLYP